MRTETSPVGRAIAWLWRDGFEWGNHQRHFGPQAPLGLRQAAQMTMTGAGDWSRYAQRAGRDVTGLPDDHVTMAQWFRLAQ